MRPPPSGGLIIFGFGTEVCHRGPVRPATAIVLVILLVIIAVAGIIQLASLLSPPA